MEILNYNQILKNAGFDFIRQEKNRNQFREWISTYYENKAKKATAYYETGRDLLIVRKQFILNNKPVMKVVIEGRLDYAINALNNL